MRVAENSVIHVDLSEKSVIIIDWAAEGIFQRPHVVLLRHACSVGPECPLAFSHQLLFWTVPLMSYLCKYSNTGYEAFRHFCSKNSIVAKIFFLKVWRYYFFRIFDLKTFSQNCEQFPHTCVLNMNNFTIIHESISLDFWGNYVCTDSAHHEEFVFSTYYSYLLECSVLKGTVSRDGG
jgi:hypothetical protein